MSYSEIWALFMVLLDQYTSMDSSKTAYNATSHNVSQLIIQFCFMILKQNIFLLTIIGKSDHLVIKH